MKKWLLLLGLLLPALAEAQGLPYTVTPPAPGALLSVCNFPATGNPCTNTATISGSVTLNPTLAQPFQIGAGGNLTFYVAGGTYQIQITGRADQIVSLGGGGGGGEPFGADTGVANAYVVTPSPAVASLTPNAIVWWKAANTNTGASTINVSGTGVKALKKIAASGSTIPADLVSGDVVAGVIYETTYDGVEWITAIVGNNPTSFPVGVGTLGSSGTPPLVLMSANPAPTAGPLLRFGLTNSNAGIDFQFDADQGFVIGAHGGANLNFIAGYVIDWGGMIFQNNTSGAAPGLNIQPQLVESSGNEIHVRDGNAVQLWNLDWNGLITTTVCTSPASPAVCTRAVSGSVALPAGCTPASCLVVNTTAMDAAGVVVVTEDMSLGAKLGVTCNTQSQLVLGGPRVTARVGGTSFTIGLDVAPTTNPMCVNFNIASQ